MITAGPVPKDCRIEEQAEHHERAVIPRLTVLKMPEILMKHGQDGMACDTGGCIDDESVVVGDKTKIHYRSVNQSRQCDDER